MTDEVRIDPFTVAIPDDVLLDLQDRISRTRWPWAADKGGWDAGVEPNYLRSLLATWSREFDWRARERELNALSHRIALIDGTRIHFVHERGNGPDPLPLILTHGFPSCFTEYEAVLPLLTDPAAHGGRAEDAFDVVVASLPGYAFSDPLTEPVLEGKVADLWCRLMRDGLGYTRFGAHGSDVGSGITIQLGLRHPAHIAGIHLSAFYLYPPPDPQPQVVREFLERQAHERSDDVAYSRMQSTRPQTVAYGLTDSPAGLAAWIVDLLRSFSDCEGEVETRFTREQILTILTIYWSTATISSAMRGYYDFEHFEPPPTDERVQVPSGFAVFADSYRRDAARPPREMAEHAFNIARWREMPRGGHFAALEEPDLFVEEIREFFRPLRDTR